MSSKRAGDLGIVEIDGILRSYSQSFLTDPSPNTGCDCVGGLDCFFDIIRALKMGSCLSADTRAPPRPPGTSIKKRRNSKSTSSLESLPKIPGRLFRNGSTHVASLCTQQGKKGINQDAMIVWENFASRADTVFCGVFDGHGPFGHLVARRVRDSLPLKLSSHYELDTDTVHNANHSFSEDSSYVSADEFASDTLFQTLKESFLKAFSFMDRELRSQPHIDCFCSGTTAVTMIKQGDYLMVGNVGDSRAVMATRADDGGIYPHQLTVDLKPNLPEEAERITRCKGRVFALRDEPEVARVWLPNNDSPGLAMARAFGDFCLKDYGLISVPDITYRCLTEKDEFIVLASDGIWDVLSNKEVVDIVATSYPRSYAAKMLVDTAVRAWKQKYPTSKVDDCAAVCLFLSPTAVAVASDGEADGGLNVEGGNDWSALEGVSRVNTLLNLPRFVPHR